MRNRIVMVFTELMTPETVQLFFKEKIHFILPGFLNQSRVRNHCICSPHFLNQIKQHYIDFPEILGELEPYQEKQYYFDALLGQRKSHRDFIYNLYKQNGLEDKIMMSYKPEGTVNAWDHMGTDNKDFIWEPGIDHANQTIRYNAQIIPYRGQDISLSFIVPVHSVYNRSAYSIVAETAFPPNPDVFFTEKIAKPLISRRLFVVFTGQHYLQGLRRLGFKTFDGIIDESYDQIDDDETRWTAAFEQVKRLCKMDQLTVLEQIRPILEHNYQIMLETDWWYSARRGLADLILTHKGR
jgi:hypothetical protein